MAEEPQALTLQWVFGISRDVLDNAVFLSNDESIVICYAAAHTIVIFDLVENRQTFLQGHRHAVTSLIVTHDRQLLLSADAGPDSLLVLWDPAMQQPLVTVSQPHKHGIAAMALSPDSTQLVTLGAVEDLDEAQEVAVWDLTGVTATTQLTPIISTRIPPGDPQLAVKFNVNNPVEFITNGKRRVYFWQLPQQLRGGAMSYYSPPLKAADFNQHVGNFVTSSFVPNSSQALTSTEDGDVVVWDRQGANPAAATRASDRQAAKIMRLHESSINVLTSTGAYVVTGAADGMVRFYDPMMRLVAWFEELRAGPVRCVAFAPAPRASGSGSSGSSGGGAEEGEPKRSTQLNELTAPDFLVTTGTGNLVAVSAASFDDPTLQPGHDIILVTPAVTTAPIAANPVRPELLLLDTKGAVQCWDLVDRSKTAEEKLPMGVGKGLALAVSRDGSVAVVGCETGHVVVLKCSSLEEVVTMKNCGQRITRVAISSNGRYIAAATSQQYVLLYGFLPYKGNFLQWDFVGKFKAHYDGVVGLSFGEAPSGETRLFSLGADGRLLEFSLEGLKGGAGVDMRACQDAAPPGAPAPTALCFAPPMPYWAQPAINTVLVVADEGFKVHAYNPDAAAIITTHTGPAWGAPLRQLLPFKCSSGGSWLAYNTGQQVVGLMPWPLTGDPATTMGLIAHPGVVAGMALMHDGRRLVTAGEGGILNLWEVNTNALQPGGSAAAAAAAAAAGQTMGQLPWDDLLGGADQVGELRDYFTTVQLQQAARGAGPGGLMERQQLKGRVDPLALPDLLRAAGHYPSNAEVEAALNHVRHLVGLGPIQQQKMQSEKAASTQGGAGAGPSVTRAGSAAGSEQRARRRSSNSANAAGRSAGGSVGGNGGSSTGGAGGGSSSGGGSGSPRNRLRSDSGVGAGGPAEDQDDDGLDFETLLGVLVNHRPVAAVTQEAIAAAFAVLGASPGSGIMRRDDLLSALQQYGEPLRPGELETLLQDLTGLSSVDDVLPEYLDAQYFASEVLGFQQAA